MSVTSGKICPLKNKKIHNVPRSRPNIAAHFLTSKLLKVNLTVFVGGGIIHYAKAHISTEQPTPRQDARVSRAHGDQERSSGLEETPRQGSQEAHAVALLTRNGVPSGRPKLRKSAEFRAVYEGGKRFDGRLMTAFVRRNDTGRHRLGITASKRVARLAVERNRMKRLLREMFRLSEATLAGIEPHYDWVFNAKRSLLKVKLADALEDFQRLVATVAKDGRGARSSSDKP